MINTTDGDGVAGSVSVSACDAVVDGFPQGWVGVVEANTGPEIRRGSVEVIHGFCDFVVHCVASPVQGFRGFSSSRISVEIQLNSDQC